MAENAVVCYTGAMWNILLLLAGLLPTTAAAQTCPPGIENCVIVNTGYAGNLPELILRVVNFLSYSIGTFCTLAFIVGGAMLVLSRGQDPLLGRAKSLMIESLIGLGLVLGARGILQIVMYVLSVNA